MKRLVLLIVVVFFGTCHAAFTRLRILSRRIPPTPGSFSRWNRTLGRGLSHRPHQVANRIHERSVKNIKDPATYGKLKPNNRVVESGGGKKSSGVLATTKPIGRSKVEGATMALAFGAVFVLSGMFLDWRLNVAKDEEERDQVWNAMLITFGIPSTVMTARQFREEFDSRYRGDAPRQEEKLVRCVQNSDFIRLIIKLIFESCKFHLQSLIFQSCRFKLIH